MLFSALVDADRLESERFEIEARGGMVMRGGFATIEDLAARLDAHLADLTRAAPPTSVNSLRAQVLSAPAQ